MKVDPLFSVLILFCLTFRLSFTSDNVCLDCLRLTPHIRNGSVNVARSLAEVDSSKFLNIKSYSGFITVKDEYDSNLFFWFFPKSNMSTTPLIIWLQGGPGYSSLKGLFDIIGPFQVEDDKVIERPVTWASNYSLLFLDQPVGTGFSFTSDDRGYTNNEDDVGEQMYEFLIQFLELFPELQEAPLFVMGESYAGKYVPALAIQIHRRKNKIYPINLRGIAIGNGLIDPLSMMHYSDFSRILGLLDDTQVEVLKIIEQDTVQAIHEERMLDAALGFNKTLEYIKKHSGVSFYNFNMDQGGAAPAFETFVNRHDIREAIHVGNASFNLNNQLVYQKMQPDMMNTTKPFVEELLEHYGVMCYSGQLDVILPYGLSRNLYSKLNWSRRPEYIKASRRRLRNAIDGTIVAYKKSGGNFAEVLIRRAGHMVPEEQPDVAKFIIDRFIEEYK